MKRVSVRFSISQRAGKSVESSAAATGHRGKVAPRFATARPAPSAAQPAAALEAHPASRPDYSLLITDDDDAFRETLRNIFEPEGFRTLLAHSGEEALEILQSQPVDLALLDQHLPRLTGLETLRIIRQVNAILPVILMTADRTQQLMRDALSAHAFCVMSKPVTRSIVVYTVHQALSRSYDQSGNIPSSRDHVDGP